MKKLSEFYKSKHLSASNLDKAFDKVVAAGIDRVELTRAELECFLLANGRELPVDIPSGSDDKFWCEITPEID